MLRDSWKKPAERMAMDDSQLQEDWAPKFPKWRLKDLKKNCDEEARVGLLEKLRSSEMQIEEAKNREQIVDKQYIELAFSELGHHLTDDHGLPHHKRKWLKKYLLQNNFANFVEMDEDDPDFKQFIEELIDSYTSRREKQCKKCDISKHRFINTVAKEVENIRKKIIPAIKHYFKSTKYIMETYIHTTDNLESILLTIHRMLMKHCKEARPGLYRDKSVVTDFYKHPDFEKVPEMISDRLIKLEAKLNISNDGSPPYAQMAWILWELYCIHPFMDGNGRTCRIFINFLLNQGRGGFTRILICDKRHKKHIAKLYRVDPFETHHFRGHFTSLIMFSHLKTIQQDAPNFKTVSKQPTNNKMN